MYINIWQNKHDKILEHIVPAGKVPISLVRTYANQQHTRDKKHKTNTDTYPCARCHSGHREEQISQKNDCVRFDAYIKEIMGSAKSIVFFLD